MIPGSSAEVRHELKKRMETTNTQEPEGQARPENLTVLQSAQAVIEELRTRVTMNIESSEVALEYNEIKGNESRASEWKGIIWTFNVFSRWLDELSGDQATQVEQGSESR